MESEDRDAQTLAKALPRDSVVFSTNQFNHHNYYYFSLVSDDTDARKFNFPISTCLVNNRVFI